MYIKELVTNKRNVQCVRKIIRKNKRLKGVHGKSRMTRKEDTRNGWTKGREDERTKRRKVVPQFSLI